MGRILINDDDAFEILDHLIKQDTPEAEYIAEKLFIQMELKGKYETYAKALLDEKEKKV